MVSILFRLLFPVTNGAGMMIDRGRGLLEASAGSASSFLEASGMSAASFLEAVSGGAGAFLEQTYGSASSYLEAASNALNLIR
jgi:hypothetical protein